MDGNSGSDTLSARAAGSFYRLLSQEDKLDSKEREKVTQKLAARLVSGHADTCAWKGNPSPASFATASV